MFNFFSKKKTAGETATLKINGMHCISCAMNIDCALEETDGVQSADTNYATSTTRVVFDPTKIQPDTLRQIITSLNYTSTVIE